MTPSEPREAEADPAETDIGAREAGKAERRRRIIRAAHDLIRETGNTGLSMRALAARAGVSLATPYNLFGSKRAILLAVLDDIRAFFDRFSQQPTTEPVARLFVAVDICVQMYLDDPAFNRAIWASLFDPSDDFRSQIFNSRRAGFWRGLVKDVADVGALVADTDVDVLFHALDRTFSATMLEWVMGDLRDAELLHAMRYGYALMLCGVAAPEWRGPLEARIRESQRALASAREARSGPRA